MTNQLPRLAEGKKLGPIDLVTRAHWPNVVSDAAGEATDSLPIATRRDTAEVNERRGSRDAGFLGRLPPSGIDEWFTLAGSSLGDYPRSGAASVDRGANKKHLDRPASAAIEKRAG